MPDSFGWLRSLLAILIVALVYWLCGCAARSQHGTAVTNFIVNPKCVTKLLDCKDMDPRQCKHISFTSKDGGDCLMVEVQQK